ncbi:MAG: GNAT family N-acetyltransferase [Candidatus Berkiellales bacterium]
MFYIRSFRIGDEKEIYQLFYDTVRNVNIKDYSAEQVDIWAPEKADLEKWRNSLDKNHTLVAVKKGTTQIIGFFDLTAEGCLDRGYVHKDYQGQGVGHYLLLAMEDKGRELGFKELFSDVSITAIPFMEKHGYVVEEKLTKIVSDVQFVNYRMRKTLK